MATELYNTSFMDNSTNIVELAIWIGNASGEPYLFGNLLLLGFFLIFLVLSFRHNFLEVLLANCFITTIIAIGLYSIELIMITTIAYPLVLFFIVLVFYLMS